MKHSSSVLGAAGIMLGHLISTPGLSAQSAELPPPSNVWAAQTELKTITLVWTRQPRAEGYRVYPAGGTPTRGIPTVEMAKSVNRLVLPVVPRFTGNYSYKVAAVYPKGRLSKKIQSNVVVPVTKKPAGDISPPSSVTARETGPGTITVTWSPVSGATAYIIGRAVTPWGLGKLCELCSTATKYVDRKVTAGAKHRYSVSALTPGGATKRTMSNEVIPTGGGGNGTPTDSVGNAAVDTLRPEGVRAFVARNESGSRVKLAWSADARAARYLIAFVDSVDDAHYGAQELFAERTVYSGTDTSTTIAAPGDTSRTTYAIVSENSHGRSQPRYATRAPNRLPTDSLPTDSTPSDSAGNVAAANQLPEGVQNLTAVLAPGGAYHQFKLYWVSDPRAEHYNVAYSVSGGAFQAYGKMRGSDTAAIVWPPVTGATASSFAFSIVSENQKGKSPPRYSNVITGHPPRGPSRLEVRAGRVPGAIELRWSPDPDATAYTISRAEDNGPFRDWVYGNAVDDRGMTVLTYVDRPPTGAILKYRIATKNRFGISAPVSAEPILRRLYQPPAGVKEAVATMGPATQVHLRWVVDSAAVAYVLRKSINGGAFVQIAELSSDRSEYQDRNAPQQRPAYQIISMNNYGPSQPVSFAEESSEIETGDSTGPVTKP